ncbi:MAG: thymidylate kinase [Candidatus Sulfotelmatobacter sp.]
MRSERVKIVSFSGIDGAGKSTQIQALANWLRSAGFSLKQLSFWDDVVMFSRFREKTSEKVFKGEHGIGSPNRPVNRRDKNVTSWPVTSARFCLYLFDALSVWRKVRQERKGAADVVIFDRYIYDELANLPVQRWGTRMFLSLVLRIVPVPDVAYVIDADPLAARQRKPEYPIEFIRKNREAYLNLSSLIPGITVIAPLAIEDAETRVREVFLKNISVPHEYLAGLPAVQ